MKPFTKKIVLESGREFYGYGFGADREATGEIVFNTSMVGYQEILSDPSYTDQMVVMTYPLIGNYGITDEDYETKYPTIGGMIVREYNDLPSNFRYTKTLGEVCEEYGIPCVWGIDTRMLTRIIRDEGTQRVIVVDASMPQEEALRRLKEAPVRRDMVERVSCRKRWFSRTANHRFDVVAVDCGIKHNIIRKLNELGGKNGIGLADIIENRLVGMKSRGVYETPGGTILYHAHNKLEELCLDKETYHYKQQVALKFADLVYNGQWYTPLRQALSAFVDSTQETVTGDVKLKLYKGNIIDAGVTSPYSLYDEEIATFDEDEVYNQADSAGFINLFGLPIKVQAKKGLTYDK